MTDWFLTDEERGNPHTTLAAVPANYAKRVPFRVPFT